MVHSACITQARRKRAQKKAGKLPAFFVGTTPGSVALGGILDLLTSLLHILAGAGKDVQKAGEKVEDAAKGN